MDELRGVDGWRMLQGPLRTGSLKTSTFPDAEMEQAVRGQIRVTKLVNARGETGSASQGNVHVFK